MRKLIPWFLSAALLILLVFQRSHNSAIQERIGARQSQIVLLQHTRDSLARQLATSAPKLDTLIDSLWLPAKVRMDTTYLTDTLPVPVEVVREIVRDADTTIKACRLVVHDCTAMVKADSAVIDSLTEQVNDYKRLSHGPVIVFNGYAATDLQQHYYAGAEARVNVWTLQAFGRVESRVDSIAPQYRVGVVIPF